MSDPYGIPYGLVLPRAPYNRSSGRGTGSRAGSSSGRGFGRLQGRLREFAGSLQQRYRGLGQQSNLANEHIQQLYEALFGSMDTASLESRARSMAANQFGPQIEAIRELMRQQETTAARNKEEVGRLFTALSGNIRQDIPLIEQNTEQGQSAIQKQYQQSQQATTGLYDQLEQEQKDLFEQLNIQAAMPEATQQQGVDETFFKQLAQTQGEQVQDYLGQIGAGSEEFTRQGSQIAQMEGTQRQSDIMTQLQELLAGYGTEVAGLQGQQRSAEQDILSQLIGGEEDRRQQNFQNLLDIARFEEQRRQFEAGQGGEQEKPTYSGVRGIRSVADEYFPNNPRMAADLSAWTSNWLAESYEADPFSRIDPLGAAREAVEEAREQGYSGSALTAIRDQVLAYFDRY